MRSILFADLPSFSAISAAALPGFCSRLTGAVAAVLRQHRDLICFRNTWGDAIVLLVKTSRGAAEIALSLQEELACLWCPDSRNSRSAQMRIAIHHGPVHRSVDLVMERACYVGSEIIRAARIEPVTPPGQVYVSAQFAACLREETALYQTRPAGIFDLPKGAGRLPLFSLSRIVPTGSSSSL